jgi:hypothetical protein
MEATRQAARPSLLSPVSFWRRLGATLALGAAVGLWATIVRPRESEAIWLYAPLLLSAIFLHVDRVLPQVLVRATLWMHLGLGAMAAVVGGEATFAGIAAASGTALLVLGSAPLETPNVRQQFAPIGYRRMFLFASVTLLGTAYVLTLAGWDWMSTFSSHRRAGVASFLEGTLLLASVIGVLRMRGWGVLAALVASVAGGAAVLVAAIPSTRGVLGVAAYDHLAVRWLFGIAAGSAFLMVSPIVLSRVFPAPHAGADHPVTARWLHSAVVGCALGIAAAGLLHRGMLHLH